MLTSTVAKDTRPGYRPYAVRVARIRRITPSFVRVTFAGDELDSFGTDRLDQRVKIVLPHPGDNPGGHPAGHVADFGWNDPATIAAGDWYKRWRELPDADRNPFRTYTVRAVRPGEVDVDMVTHPDGGPASRWLEQAVPGDALVLVGPDARSRDSGIGIDFHPGTAEKILLVGDETAAPAICSILEHLGPEREAHVFLEVPASEDVLPIVTAARTQVTWLPRNGAGHGTLLEPAVTAWVSAHPHVYLAALSTSEQRLEEVDVDRDLLWDSFGDLYCVRGGEFYAWLAGEAGVIKRLRRLLVTTTGITRTRVSFMGYWRLGRAEAQ
ncbi:siderophore-interacting protein [Pseudactinotalea sp. HY158]|uniref:siderophore-interacting protein n=1 Tax=Pseudactinotalea sp. HY158 TaxID=2654547 RepID=UPI001E2B5DE3|nr:siderophore-interacting protein [Pseudactinotalea sp. HY158]